MGLRITSVEGKITEDGVREVHVKFNDDKVVKIGVYGDSWECWNAPSHYRWKVIDIADQCNNWLHGKGELPKF